MVAGGGGVRVRRWGCVRRWGARAAVGCAGGGGVRFGWAAKFSVKSRELRSAIGRLTDIAEPEEEECPLPPGRPIPIKIMRRPYDHDEAPDAQG
ncbi:hypothetical protein Ait01nite_047230 [Actinoplanes italicus]|nr:hypothetical protein Ait01nite_047230 [Actinoplanes italicus]